MKDIRVNSVEQSYVGTEPTWTNFDETNLIENEQRIVAGYNWYNYVVADKDKHKYVIEFLNSYGKKAATSIEAISELEHWEIPNWLMSLCRMQSRGLVLTDDRKKGFSDRLIKLINLGVSRRTEKSANAPVAKVSVQININRAASEATADIEAEIDKIMHDQNHTFKCYDWLSEKKIGPMIAAKIADRYRASHEEIKIALAKSDEQVVEGYRSYSRKHLKVFDAFYQSIIDDCETWSRNQKKSPKARKKKIKSADQQVRKLRYLKAYSELKLVSIDPVKIINASELWLFNTKYRKLQYYVANDRGGFQIKGTTIQNFHEVNSTAKTLRKPEETLNDIVNGGPKAIIKTFEKLRVKASKCNGRIGEATIILRVIK